MSQRTVKSGPKNAQLDLHLMDRKPAIRTHQSEPIAVRIPEAIRLIGIGRSKLYELIASGDVEVVKIGRCTLITTASFVRSDRASEVSPDLTVINLMATDRGSFVRRCRQSAIEGRRL